jgi:hypothetical protein
MPLTVGSRLGHYDVTARIGEGGAWGRSIETRDNRLDRNACRPGI